MTRLHLHRALHRTPYRESGADDFEWPDFTAWRVRDTNRLVAILAASVGLAILCVAVA